MAHALSVSQKVSRCQRVRPLLSVAQPPHTSSRKLNVVADSSALAEYSAVSACGKENIFIRNLINELGFTVSGPIVIAIDNSAAIKISENNGVTKLTKHFDFSVWRIREEVESLRALLQFVTTENQIADIFTKTLDEKTFLLFRKFLLRRDV